MFDLVGRCLGFHTSGFSFFNFEVSEHSKETVILFFVYQRGGGADRIGDIKHSKLFSKKSIHFKHVFYLVGCILRFHILGFSSFVNFSDLQHLQESTIRTFPGIL